MIHGEAISFLGDTVWHQGMDVAIFLQTNSLVEVIIEDDHDGNTLFNSIFYHGHPDETAARCR